MSEQKKKQNTTKPIKKTATKVKSMPTGDSQSVKGKVALYRKTAIQFHLAGVEMVQSGTDAMQKGILAMQAGVRDMQSAIGEQRKKYAEGTPLSNLALTRCWAILQPCAQP